MVVGADHQLTRELGGWSLLHGVPQVSMQSGPKATLKTQQGLQPSSEALTALLGAWRGAAGKLCCEWKCAWERLCWRGLGHSLTQPVGGLPVL